MLTPRVLNTRRLASSPTSSSPLRYFPPPCPPSTMSPVRRPPTRFFRYAPLFVLPPLVKSLLLRPLLLHLPLFRLDLGKTSGARAFLRCVQEVAFVLLDGQERK